VPRLAQPPGQSPERKRRSARAIDTLSCSPNIRNRFGFPSSCRTPTVTPSHQYGLAPANPSNTPRPDSCSSPPCVVHSTSRASGPRQQLDTAGYAQRGVFLSCVLISTSPACAILHLISHPVEPTKPELRLSAQLEFVTREAGRCPRPSLWEKSSTLTKQKAPIAHGMFRLPKRRSLR